MYYSLIEQLFEIQEIQKAFKKTCLDKMLVDGYVDMRSYISQVVKKEEILKRLLATKSIFAVLYEEAYPKQDAVYTKWFDKIQLRFNDSSSIDLTEDESNAIVNWVFKSLNKIAEREKFTRTLFSYLKELHGIQHQICLTQGVVYNSAKVELNFIKSLSDIISYLSGLNQGTNKYFFRGHANANYMLQPSIMRKTQWLKNERKMYHDLIINCPKDFVTCRSHLEKLVQMQHYGLPTRMLDITGNPYVALYFACEGQREVLGELVIITANEHEIKYPQSDTVAILASLPIFSYDIQCQFLEYANSSKITDEEFNRKVSRLIQEVRLENPAFQPEINRSDLANSFIVYALKNNNRIVKQDGAFILCGLQAKNDSLSKFRYKSAGKMVVLLIESKEQILRELDMLTINRASLFPEIECVAEYIRNKFQRTISRE